MLLKHLVLSSRRAATIERLGPVKYSHCTSSVDSVASWRGAKFAFDSRPLLPTVAMWILGCIALAGGSLLGREVANAKEGAIKRDLSRQTVTGADLAVGILRFKSGIRCIFEDSLGRFWFGSHDEGVSRWDGHEFTYYTVAEGLSGNQVRTIQEDAEGNMWFGTNQGISRFADNSFTTLVGNNQTERNVAWGTTWRNGVGDLWFVGDSGEPGSHFKGQGAYRVAGETVEFLPFPVPAEVANRGDYRVTDIRRGRKGMLWFGTYPAVFGYDGRNFTVLDARAMERVAEDEPFHIRSVFEDSRGTLWIGNNGLGVLRYDGQSLINFTQQHGLSHKDKPASESLSRVFSIAEDASGKVWFGTRDSGVWRYDGERLEHFTARHGLANALVWTIYRDRRDRLWFGLGDGSVYWFNGTSFDKFN